MISTFTSQRPAAGSFPDYYAKYVNRVPSGDILQILRRTAAEAIALLESLPPAKWDYRYGPDKWTVKEVILHLIDTERIMAYRALRFSREDRTPLASFDQDAYVPASGASGRSPASLIAEFQAVREASVQLFKGFSQEQWEHQGTTDSGSFTVRSVAYIIAGHELHHRTVLEEKYLA